MIDSPIGPLLLVGDGEVLHRLDIRGGRYPLAVHPSWRHSDDSFREVRDQLTDYFAGRRHTFDIPLELRGSEFERRVWQALRQIPYGETRSYGQLARSLSDPGAARAVGLANARNPVAVIVPCHRVIGSDGTLTGYGGGLERKRFLLDLEGGITALAI
jgi:methylated-DNA-[protein]-cysteine S-methyltransferase